jgi:membrane-bound ClpP family serine protease
MSVVWIVTLIIFALILLVIEILILPGVSIAGVGAVLFFIAAIITAYSTSGSTAAIITFFASLGTSVITTYFSLKSKTWKRMSLETSIDSKANNDVSLSNICVGDTGKTVSRLAPVGNILINNYIVEAQSTGEYVNADIEVKVVRIENSKIIIKPL